MSGRIRSSSRSRQLSEQELFASFEEGLTTLGHLARVYDSGYAPIAFAMATEVQKILTENSAAVRLRGSRVFTSPPLIENETTIVSAIHRLTSVEIGSDPPIIKFIPKFHFDEAGLRTMPFKEWWNRDIIYRASAAEPGTAPGLIPVNGSPEVPFEQREKINRRDLVKLLRNKLGAHQEAEMPELLDELQSSDTWGAFAVQTPKGYFCTMEGSLETVVGPLPAMMRQITHELLVAYDRDDPPPAALAAL